MPTALAAALEPLLPLGGRGWELYVCLSLALIPAVLQRTRDGRTAEEVNAVMPSSRPRWPPQGRSW